MEQVELGELILQPGRQLLAGNAPVPLGRRGLAILSALAEAQGNLVTKDELMAAVWPGTIVEENAIQAQISALRKALGKEAGRLKTVHGLGYRLDLPAAEQPVAAAADMTQASILVLPFDNMSADAEQAYFADGITEDVITDLSKASALRVIARTSAFTLKGQNVDVTEVARRFRVSHVLEGSVRKSGQRVRITAQLADGRTGAHLWADRFDRDLADIFDLQDEIVRTIVRALRIRLLPTELAAIRDRGTDSLEAYDLLLRSRSFSLRYGTEFVARSVELARAAIAADPTFIHAYRQLAAALDQMEFLMPERRADIAIERADLAARAATVAPGDPLFALMEVRRLIGQRQLIEADRHNSQVPAGSYAPVFWATPEFFGFYTGRFGPVLEMLRRQAMLDPLDRVTLQALHDLLDIAGRLDEADEVNERMKDLPGDRSFLELARFLRGKSRASPEAQARQYRAILGSSPFIASLPLLDELEPVLEDPEAARQAIMRAARDPACADHLRQIWIALLAAHFDAVDVALDILRRVFGDPEHMIDLRCIIWQSPLAGVRRDPRFKDLLRNLGLVEYWRATERWGDLVRPADEDDFEVIG